MIIFERKDYETLFVIKQILNKLKNLLKTSTEDKVSFDIIKDELLKVRDRFPKEFRGFEVNVEFDDIPQGLNLSAGAQERYFFDELVSSEIVINIQLDERFKGDVDSFFREFGTLFASELKGILRHEIEHLGQKSEDKGYKDPSDVVNYYMSNDEVDAHLVQYLRLAKYHRISLEDSLEYLFDSIKQAMDSSGMSDDDIEENLEKIKTKYIERAMERFPKFKQKMQMIAEWKRHI
jgi:hypothetical protein